MRKAVTPTVPVSTGTLCNKRSECFCAILRAWRETLPVNQNRSAQTRDKTPAHRQAARLRLHHSSGARWLPHAGAGRNFRSAFPRPAGHILCAPRSKARRVFGSCQPFSMQSACAINSQSIKAAFAGFNRQIDLCLAGVRSFSTRRRIR